MKWFDKWFAKKCKQAWENENKLNEVRGELVSRVSSEKTMNLGITRANGGWVVESNQYDKKTDRNNQHIHIVTDDKDLGEELNKIITYENLYR